MQLKKLFFLLFLLSAGSVSAQFGDCDSHGVNAVYSLSGNQYVDANNDGCRDGSIVVLEAQFDNLLRSAPISPLGNYFRIGMEVYGTNTNNHNSEVLMKSMEFSPDTYTWSTANSYTYRRTWNFANEANSFKYFFVRLRILDYRWITFGNQGLYTGFSSQPCNSPIYEWCPGVGNSNSNGEEPDLEKEGYASLTSSDGTTFIPGVGDVPKLRHGSSFTYKVPCKNTGDADANNFQIETFVTTSNSFPTSAIVPGNAVGSIQSIATLNDGATVQHEQTDHVSNHTSKFTTSGFKYFHTYFDTQMNVTESSETNNSWPQRAYFYSSGTAGREGTINISHNNTSNLLSFLYLDENPQTQQLEPTIGNGLSLALFPAGTAMQLQPPAFQTTIQSQNNTIDISSIPPGIYRVVLDNRYVKKIAVN